MGSLYVVTPSPAELLVPLDLFMTEVGIEEGDRETAKQILEHACSRIESREFLDRPLKRQQYREELDGSESDVLELRVKPLARLDAISFDGSALTVGDFDIESEEDALLYRLGGFHSGSSRPNPWSVTTTAGYFVGDDKFIGSVSVANGDRSYNGTGFPAHLVPGDEFEPKGFTNAVNNGRKIVETATASKIIVTSATPLVTEAAAPRTLRFDIGKNGLPGSIVRAVIMLAKDGFQRRASAAGQGALIEETVEGESTVRWAAPNSSSQQTGDGAVEASVRAMIAAYLPKRSAIVELLRA